jgi:hypothetical protein
MDSTTMLVAYWLLSSVTSTKHLLVGNISIKNKCYYLIHHVMIRSEQIARLVTSKNKEVVA